MTVTAKKLFDPTFLTGSAATYYTVPGSTRTIIKKLTLTNTDSVTRTVTIYLVPSGGSAAASNVILSAQGITAGETYEVFVAEGQTLAAGDTIQALASTTSVVNMQASGVEIV